MAENVQEPGDNAEGSLDQLASENALLRASLAEMRVRLGDLEDSSERDSLTGLPNRERFLRELERVVEQVNRHGTPAALLHIDLNGFRAVNKQHGRAVGDAALIHVARVMSRLIRTTDIAGRLRGDEFGLILDHLDHNSAIDTSERLSRCIADSPFDVGRGCLRLNVAIGVATILPGDDAKDVLRRASRNMSRAKQDA